MANPVEDVKIPDPSFMENYDFGGDYTPPPQPKTVDEKGKATFIKFTAQAPSADKINLRDKATGKWLTTREGLLKAVIEGIKLVDSGYEFRETHIGTGQYKKYRGGQPTGESRNASPALDYLHAHGISSKQITFDSAGAYEEAFKHTADRQFLVTADWGAYDNDAKQDVASKWEDFPVDPDNAGARLPYIERNGKRFWARMQVKRYVSAVSKDE